MEQKVTRITVMLKETHGFHDYVTWKSYRLSLTLVKIVQSQLPDAKLRVDVVVLACDFFIDHESHKYIITKKKLIYGK